MLVMSNRFNGGSKLATGVGLEDVALRANLKRVLDKGSVACHTQEHNLRTRSNLTYQKGGLHSVDAGHSDIEQHHIGLPGCRQVNGFASILCFANDASITQ